VKDGDRADDADCWLRNVISATHVRRGVLHHSALKGQLKAPSPSRNRPWSHELSGRLLSRTNDPQAEGEAYCAERIKEKAERGETVYSSIRFLGVAAALVSTLRHENGVTLVDIIYTPRHGDEAHSDLVALSASDEQIMPLIDWIQDQLTVFPSGTLSNIKDALTLPEAQPATSSGGSLKID
jgi:hypothetical protein